MLLSFYAPLHLQAIEILMIGNAEPAISLCPLWRLCKRTQVKKKQDTK